MNEDTIRMKKIEEMLEKSRSRQEQELQAELKINQVLNKLLTDEAKARLNNVRLVKKELFQAALQTIVYLAQQGQIESKIDDQQLKSLLEKLIEKKEISIRRK